MIRQARQTRPQLVCIVADESGSMAGPKAHAATIGLREMIMECQARGPAGPGRSYFELLLVTFDTLAHVHPSCDMTPVRDVDPESVGISGSGASTNLGAALELVLGRLASYVDRLKGHPERAQHPLPIVLVFSDGEHNSGPDPRPIAARIQALALDGEPVVIAAAGVCLQGGYGEAVLRAIATTECYVDITNAQALTAFISSVGSSGASGPKAVAKVIKDLEG